MNLINTPEILDVPFDNHTEIIPPPPTTHRHEYPPYQSVTLCPVASDMSKVIIKTVDDAVHAAPPKRHANDTQLFLLARAARALEINSGKILSNEQLNKIFKTWHLAGRIKNQLDPDKSFEDYQIKFFKNIAKAKVPLGRVINWEALLQELNTRSLPAEADNFNGDAMRRLIGLCKILQEWWGEAPFFLGCRKAGEVIGLKKTVANEYLNALVGMKILELVSKGGKSNAVFFASRYRYR